MVHNWNGPLPLISTFKKFFMSQSSSSSNIVVSNNFSELQQYYLQKNLPIAMANLRTVHNVCPIEVVRFILDLMRFNENSKNAFSDSYYRASLIDSLANTVTASIASLQNIETSANLSPEMHLVVEEICLRLNLEKIVPTFQYVVSTSCLRALRRLQKLGHIPEDIAVFKQYAHVRNTFDGVRMCAFEILVEFLTLRPEFELIEYLLDAVDTDHSYTVKQHVVQQLHRSAPIKFNFDEISKPAESLLNRLWHLMAKYALNYRLKTELAKLYHALYGFGKPKCLRQIKETIKINETIEAVNLF